MTYENFMRELLTAISQREEAVGKQIRLTGADGLDVDWESALGQDGCDGVMEPDGVRVHGDMLCITWRVCGQIQFLHWRMGSLYASFCREGWQGVLPGIVCKLKQHNIFGEYRTHPDRIVVRPLCYTLNREMLEDSIYWRFGDIALILYILVGVPEECVAVRVSRALAQQWHVPDGILLANAWLHTCSVMPPRLYGSTDGGYRLTNKEGAGGA